MQKVSCIISTVISDLLQYCVPSAVFRAASCLGFAV